MDMARTLSSRLACAVAMACTAAMNVMDGVNTRRPAMNAVPGDGLAIIRATMPLPGLPGSGGFGLRATIKAPAARARMPRPSRRP